MSEIHVPGRPVLMPADARAVVRMQQDLATIDALWQRLDVAVVTEPAAGSQASSDRSDKLRAYAHDQAATGLRAALDHLRAWRTILRSGEIPMYGQFSLLRTAHEAALLAIWLLDLEINPDGRRVRGIAAQFADYEERRKFEAAAGITSKPQGKLAAERLSDLTAAAKRLGLMHENDKGKWVLNVRVPDTVDLFDRYEPVQPGAKGQILYRLYSGYAHAKQWALMLGAQRMGPYDEKLK